ncbi:MAG: FkbM family methyltransferase [Bacteroidales bacterium]|nr:FkbM family methyltransferase [Bacteroidales bacterium]
MKNLFKILKFITSHPVTKNRKVKSILRFFKWQIISKLYPYPIVFPYIGNSELLVRKSLHSATANYYVGLQEFEEMSFVLHLLIESDVFFDIGANIGIYTILASKIKRAETHSFEPVKETAFFLKCNIVLNEIENLVEIHNYALGDKKGNVGFSNNLDSQNHVLNSNIKADYTINVEMLDEVAKKTPLLIKMDVEGFEMHVLNGAKNILEDENFKALIIEMNGSTNRYGVSDDEIHELLTVRGFKVYTYYPFKKEIKEKEKYSVNGNNIYIRDLEFVKKRLEKADIINVYGISV